MRILLLGNLKSPPKEAHKNTPPPKWASDAASISLTSSRRDSWGSLFNLAGRRWIFPILRSPNIKIMSKLGKNSACLGAEVWCTEEATPLIIFFCFSTRDLLGPWIFSARGRGHNIFVNRENLELKESNFFLSFLKDWSPDLAFKFTTEEDWSAARMGLMTILKKMKQKEKEMRLLILYPFLIFRDVKICCVHRNWFLWNYCVCV